MGNVGTNVGDFHPADGSDGHYRRKQLQTASLRHHVCGASKKELQRHNAAYQAPDENKRFDSRGVYGRPAVAAASLEKGGDRVILLFARGVSCA